MEIEGRYIDLTIRRWQKLTGERAYHAGTGVFFDHLACDEVSRG
jgi:hypothetical protein